MNDSLAQQGIAGRLNLRQMLAPLLIVLILSMMVLPLPPFILDLLFTFNIALALTVMMVSAQMVKPLDFAALPTVLLVTPVIVTLTGTLSLITMMWAKRCPVLLKFSV